MTYMLLDGERPRVDADAEDGDVRHEPSPCSAAREREQLGSQLHKDTKSQQRRT